ncbi:MAG: N-acetylmuramoyl-L-alanine amidase [Pseudomonadota bacterium]|nr:N-acetylmuramoyl-L-alanine amidase [Pseudomonadota bacterium]
MIRFRKRFARPGAAWRRATGLVLTLLLVLCGALATHAAPARVTAIRTGENVDATRIVLDMTASTTWNLFVLEDPYRVVVDLEGAEWDLQGQPDPVRGLVEGLRFGTFRKGVGRLVMDTTQPVVARRVFMLPPQAGQSWRLVIDLGTANAAEFADARRAAPEPDSQPVDRSAWPAGVPPLPPPRPGARAVVVIDPGHGGVDPGALGASGLQEKDLVLRVGLALRDSLVATGRYRVVMTRDDDTFVPLSGRVAVARRVNADLFVSVHADAAAGRTAVGAGVYTLSERASDKEAAALARRENRADLIAGVDLSDQDDDVTSILIDLAQRETMNRSARLAQTVVVELGRKVTMRANPHRFAGFRVLTAPDVPSVLVEIGFLTNREEERRLGARETQAKIAAGLTSAIEAWFATRQAAR